MHHHHTLRKLAPNALGRAALLLAAALAAVPARAADAAPPPMQMPLGYKQFHVHYDINADGSYTEQNEQVLTVLTPQGVQMSRQVPLTSPGEIAGNGQIEGFKAYTLKQNGQRIDATRATVPTPPGAVPLVQMVAVAFSGVGVGDTLVVSYKATHKVMVPNNFALNQMLPQQVPYGDAVVSLTAPASMKLRVETSGIEKGQGRTEGGLQQWEWKYQNTPGASAPGAPPFAALHVSTFKDTQAEMAAMSKAYEALMPRCFVPPGIPNDGPNAAAQFRAQIAGAFWNSPEQLKKLAGAWNTAACVMDDGRPRLALLSDGIYAALNQGGGWDKGIARVDELKKLYPKEAFVALAEVAYWTSYAWDARGGGYASSVSGDGWKLFQERLEKAEKILLETKSYSAQLPTWYDEMITVQSALNRPEDERDRVFVEAVKRYPTYYPIYFTMLDYLSPKWGGTWRTVDNMIKWSVEHTKAQEGMTLYARLYWVVSGDPEVKLFEDTFASWPRMKQGFEDMMARHPKSKWNLNNFAKFACMAGDKETFLKLRAQIGTGVVDAAWPENTSLDLCETKFGYAG